MGHYLMIGERKDSGRWLAFVDGRYSVWKTGVSAVETEFSDAPDAGLKGKNAFYVGDSAFVWLFTRAGLADLASAIEKAESRCVLIDRDLVEDVWRKVQERRAYAQECGLVPFVPVPGNDKAPDNGDSVLAFLEWMHWWVEWAIAQCNNPVLVRC